MRIGIYPGTFDPVTKGHLHIIERASKLVDHLIVSVAPNTRKAPMFSQDERLEMVSRDIDNMRDKHCEISVEGFDELLIHYARKKKATCIVRGLRAVSDFEYEFQMTGMNAKLDDNIETVFLMASDKWQFVSSSFIKEISALGGDMSDFITPNVKSRLEEKIKQNM
ncbi:MAG: pantetheine-phosphate adenylyltransferase [Micavibrio sp.]|nr:pantetheine-phosphate adenylyltransferase [Micavibrio sp.]|tara:strand:- start:241 stop:738 length:498 start_codon:yes stop_codon:yes gene_type:complete